MSDFNDKLNIGACSTGMAMSSAMPYLATASGCVMPFDPRDMMAPEPIYETRVAKKEEPVSAEQDQLVTTMKLLDFDPNKPLIDADRLKEEQAIIKQLSLQADARLALFMDNCRKLRESDPMQLPSAVDTFTNTLIDLYFEGRAPLDTTDRHSFTMKLVMKAAIMNLVLSQDPDRLSK